MRSLTTPTGMDAMLALQLVWILWRRHVTCPFQKLNVGPLDSLNLPSVKTHLSHFLMKMCTTFYMKCIKGGGGKTATMENILHELKNSV